MERVRRPLPLPRIQDPGRRPDALCRTRPLRPPSRHARLLHAPPGSSPRATTSSVGHPRCARKNLPLVVDNPRFLILPWIEIPNLGSHILALVRRRLPADWAGRYNVTPVLIETFVETPRYTGAVYKASGWTLVGTTQGRGRKRPGQALRQAPQGRLAPPPQKELATSAQPLESLIRPNHATKRTAFTHFDPRLHGMPERLRL